MTRTIAVEENKPAQRPAPSAETPKVTQTEAQRFAGQPFVLQTKLNRAMEELYLYRASGRHHSASETSDPKAHRQWRADAMELCLALRDAIAQGLLEPVKQTQCDE